MHTRPLSTTALGALIAVLALAGCGGSKSSSSTTTAASATPSTSASTTESATTTTTASSSAAEEKVPTVDIQLASPVKLEPIARRYTCDGADVSLPIVWSHVPPGTVEIDLFLFNLIPVHEKLIPNWAVAGLKPIPGKLAAGQLPPGAIVGRNHSGKSAYSLCPPKGRTVRYAVLIYALPKKIPAKPGFDADALREEALHASKSVGLLGLSYKRA